MKQSIFFLWLYNLGKKHRKRRSVSPIDAAPQGLYSDHEQEQQTQPQQQQQERHEQSGQQVNGHTQSPAPENRPLQEGNQDNNQQHSQAAESNGNDPLQGGVARSEEAQAIPEPEKRKSSSSKKKHHRRDHHDQYNTVLLFEGIILCNDFLIISFSNHIKHNNMLNNQIILENFELNYHHN